MSSFNILPKIYYKTNIDIIFVSKGKSKEVCGLYCISHSTKREKKKEKKKKSKKRRRRRGKKMPA